MLASCAAPIAAGVEPGGMEIVELLQVPDVDKGRELEVVLEARVEVEVALLGVPWMQYLVFVSFV